MHHVITFNQSEATTLRTDPAGVAGPPPQPHLHPPPPQVSCHSCHSCHASCHTNCHLHSPQGGGQLLAQPRRGQSPALPGHPRPLQVILLSSSSQVQVMTLQVRVCRGGKLSPRHLPLHLPRQAGVRGAGGPRQAAVRGAGGPPRVRVPVWQQGGQHCVRDHPVLQLRAEKVRDLNKFTEYDS